MKGQSHNFFIFLSKFEVVADGSDGQCIFSLIHRRENYEKMYQG